MAMTAAGLTAAIKTQMLAIPGVNITDEAQLDGFCKALGDAIIPYFVANAKATIPINGIATVGGPAAQQGPPAPVLLPIA